MKRMLTVGLMMVGLFAGITHADIPYPAALDKAAVHETKIADLNCEGLLVGNGDLNDLLYERDGTLCLRISKNDIWDARVDTLQDPPLLKVNVTNHQWTAGGGLNQSYHRPFPSPRTAAIVLTLRLLNPWTGQVIERATTPGQRLAFAGTD